MRTGCTHLLIGENNPLTAVTYYKESVQSSSHRGRREMLGPGEPKRVKGTQKEGQGIPKEVQESLGQSEGLREDQEGLKEFQKNQGRVRGFKEGQRQADS